MQKNKIVTLPRRPALLVLCVAIIAVASPGFVQAQEWRFEPIVKVGGEYDDNGSLNIRTDEEVVLQGYLLDLEAGINYSSAKTSFVFQPRFLSRNYSDEPEFDSDDYFLRSIFSRRGQSSTVGFRVNFDEQLVRNAERTNSDLDIDDPTEITDDDTGRVLLSGSRNKWQFAPYWSYQISDISSVRADIAYIDAQYDDVFEGRLVDYSDSRLNLNYRRSFSSVNSGLLTATARRYSPVNSVADITGYGLMAGLERTLSEKSQLVAMIGLEETQQSGFASDPEVVGSITLTRNLQTIRMLAQYRRSINASGAGNLAVRDSLNVNFRRRLSEKIAAGLGVRAYKSSGAAASIAIEDRNYVQLQSNFLWYLTRSFVIEVDYRYTVNDRSATVGERSNANQVNLWFVYQPKTTPRL